MHEVSPGNSIPNRFSNPLTQRVSDLRMMISPARCVGAATVGRIPVVGAVFIALTYPEVGHHARLVDKRQKEMRSGPAVTAEQSYQLAVHARRFGVREATGPTPDRDDRLLDQFNWAIVRVRLRLWRAPARRRLPKCHAAEHPLVTASANGVPRNSQGSLTDNLGLILKQSGKVKATRRHQFYLSPPRRPS